MDERIVQLRILESQYEIIKESLWFTQYNKDLAPNYDIQSSTEDFIQTRMAIENNKTFIKKF